MKRGSIIFNHKQTEDLLKNGHIASRGRAYAEGNAHSGNITIWPPASSKDQWEGTGYDSWDDPTYDLQKALDDAAGTVEDFEETMDWIAIRMEEHGEKISQLNAELENKVGYSDKNTTIDEIIQANKNKSTDAALAETYYANKAESYLTGLDPKLIDAAKNGSIAISEFTNESDQATVDAIQKYREYAQLAADAKLTQEEITAEISDLAKQKFDNVADQYENEISLIEAENESLETNLDLQEGQLDASKQAYDTMLNNSRTILTSLEQEATALQTVLEQEVTSGNIAKYSEEWYEMKNTIAETKNAADEYRASIEDLALDKFNLVSTEYENQIGLIENVNEQLEAEVDLIENEGYEAVNGYYDSMIGNTEAIQTALRTQKTALEEILNEQVKLGNIKLNSEEWYEMKNAIDDVASAITDCTAKLEEYAQKKLDAITNQFENEHSLLENENEQLQARIDLMEESGEIPSPIYYKELIANANEHKASLKDEKKALEDLLEAEVAAGRIEVGSDAWYEQIEAINQVNDEIMECVSNVEEYQNAINDIHWDNFDELMNRYDYVKNETQNLIDLMDDADMVITPETDDGWGALDVKWTDEGLATLGLYAQQMEVAEYSAQQYAEQIDELNKQYTDGRYSEAEYLAKLNELKDAQYDSIEAYQDTKDAIVELNKSRVDAIKEGIEKEIEAYQELIEVKKEELDAEKDLYDFQKGVMEQQKDIADIERKLAALSGDNSASARAQRAKLEAELYEAKADLEETYYDRSISNQQEALDQELEDFQNEKDSEIEKWEEYLTNVEGIIAESLFNVQLNADTVYSTLTGKASEYNLTLSDYIKKPWEEAATTAVKFSDVYDALEIAANEYGITLAQLLAAPWSKAIDESMPYKELFGTLKDVAEGYGFDLAGFIVSAWGGAVDGSVPYQDVFPLLNTLADTYGLTLSELLKRSWGDGVTAIGVYDSVFANSTSATITQLEGIKTAWQAVIDKINAAAQAEVEFIEKQNEAIEAAKNNTNNNDGGESDSPPPPATTPPSVTPTPPDTITPPNSTNNNTEKDVTIGNQINAGDAPIYDSSYNSPPETQLFGDDPIYTIIGENNGYWKVRHHKLNHGVTGWFKKSDVHAYAKGTTGVDKDQLALIDELGDELVMHASGGRLTFLSKGSAVIPHNISENLMELGAIDPQDMLDRNRPQISAPHIVNNEININMNIAEVVHIDEVTNDTIPDLTKAVRKEMDSYMTRVNNAIRSKVR